MINPNSPNITPDITRDEIFKTKHAEDARRRYQAEFSLNSISPQKHSPFDIDQSSLRPTIPKVSHWSIAWSDLMMTMFILFLSMYVYQAENKDFLASEKFLINNNKEIIGGDTREALQVEKNKGTSFPFMVTKPAAPLITSGSVKKIEPITLQDIDLESTFSAEEIAKTLDMIAEESFLYASSASPESEVPKESAAQIPRAEKSEPILQPAPLNIDDYNDTSVNSIFSQSQKTLDTHNLNDFASINLVEDKAVRIILTGDLLFNTGQATLSTSAITSLKKIAEVIHDTPHQVNIEGHTDNVPVIAAFRYASNWELSLARANAVARFLIEDMHMNPRQFVISGFSSYRPVEPNTTAQNRAINRRVEIVITKNSPQAQNIDTTNNT